MYAEYLKDVVILVDLETMALTKECSSRVMSKLTNKINDFRSFKGDESMLCVTWSEYKFDAPSVLNTLGLGKPRFSKVVLEIADRSRVLSSERIIEDVLIRVGKLIIATYFVILDYEADDRVSIILGRPF